MRFYKQLFIGFLMFLPLLLYACALTPDKFYDEPSIPLSVPLVTEEKIESEGLAKILPPEPGAYEEQTDSPDAADNGEQLLVPEPSDEPHAPEPIDYQTIRPDESGNIMIIMYHGLVEKTTTYDRSPADFINDLQTLYDQNYRLISVSDLANGHITTPAGYTPVALTFDDGKTSTFSMMEQDGVLIPTPGCMVDILNRFCEEHPEFGKAAAFYINGDNDAFSGSGTLAERLAYLLDAGYELGNHTWSHATLNKLDAAGVQREVGRLDQLIRDLVPGYVPNILSYPFGIRPTEALRKYALEGVYEDRAYSYIWGMREGQSNVTANPFHIKFDPWNVPRVRASDDSTPAEAVQDFWFELRNYEKNPNRRYISDGDPSRVSVPESQADKIDPDALGGRELFVYTVDED
jgi:peptidoglycan/xylan/chitin deacetylase (PgdA/CDA1 family)